MNAVDERSKEDLAAAVKLLRARMGEMEEQLERMRLRVNGLERTVSSVVEMDYPAFCAAARDAYDRLNQQNRGFVGVVPIPELRRTLGPRLSRAVFEENLVKLHQEGLVQLMPHPGTISAEKRKDGLVHATLGAFYFVRWERH
jgi:hypothetical protein